MYLTKVIKWVMEKENNGSDLSPAGGSGRAIYMLHEKHNYRETEGGLIL